MGDGPYRDSLEGLAKHLEIEGNVSFEGSRRDMPSVYASLDIFVLPSLEEGLPIAVLEALASRCAVVATSVGAIPELIVSGQTGVLVRPGEVDELVEAIRSLIKNPELRRHLGKKGETLVRERFSSEQMARKYFQLYERLAVTKPGQVPELSQFNSHPGLHLHIDRYQIEVSLCQGKLECQGRCQALELNPIQKHSGISKVEADKTRSQISVYLMDLWSFIPYYMARLCASLRAESIEVTLGSTCYHLDRNYFRKVGLTPDPILLDSGGGIRSSRLRRLVKAFEYLVNLVILAIRMTVSKPDISTSNTSLF